MNRTSKILFGWGAILAGLAVAAGAFGAHTLASLVSPDRLVTFETAARYQMYHALGLLALAWAYTLVQDRLLRWAGVLFGAGVVLFSGSLYLLVLTDTSWLGAITPLGGFCFIVGWLLSALAFFRSASHPRA